MIGIHEGGLKTKPNYALISANHNFGTIGVQGDEAFRVPYDVNVVGYGAMGDAVAADVDDGGAAIDFNAATLFVDIPMRARLVDTQTQLKMAAGAGRRV